MGRCPPIPRFDEASLSHLDPALHAQRLIRLSEVSKRIGLGRSTVYKYVTEREVAYADQSGISDRAPETSGCVGVTSAG
ncbi:MAG: AlpA family phage regulatory protein [Pseudomonadota bacterium]|nr:AlpA family phage regulatory protein [Pseudomonadota bacterium]